MFRGGRTNTVGLCPCCGANVPRTHAWSPGRAADAYRCGSCGTFEYGTTGVAMPVPSQASLATVLGPVDCIL